MDAADPRMKALSAFKDWSNYLLVTTVAAIGWVGSTSGGILSANWAALSLWSLSAAMVFGVLTLALIPLVAQQMRDDHTSIYKVQVSFSIFNRAWSAYLTQACRPQHVLFMIGITAFAIGSVGSLSVVMLLMAKLIAILALVIGILSQPQSEEQTQIQPV